MVDTLIAPVVATAVPVGAGSPDTVRGTGASVLIREANAIGVFAEAARQVAQKAVVSMLGKAEKTSRPFELYKYKAGASLQSSADGLIAKAFRLENDSAKLVTRSADFAFRANDADKLGKLKPADAPKAGADGQVRTIHKHGLKTFTLSGAQFRNLTQRFPRNGTETLGTQSARAVRSMLADFGEVWKEYTVEETRPTGKNVRYSLSIDGDSVSVKVERWETVEGIAVVPETVARAAFGI